MWQAIFIPSHLYIRATWDSVTTHFMQQSSIVQHDTPTYQSATVTEGQPDIRSGGRSCESSTVCTNNWLFDVLYGRDTTRIAYAVGILSRFMHKPWSSTLEHFEAYLQNILLVQRTMTSHLHWMNPQA